jgi:site-specific recombinase XerC
VSHSALSQVATLPVPDLVALLPSWELSLRAERKSPATIKVYGDGVRRFLVWCEETGHLPQLSRRALAEFVADLLEAGAEPATARSRYLSLRRFSAWLVEERELPGDPFDGGEAAEARREGRAGSDRGQTACPDLCLRRPRPAGPS